MHRFFLILLGSVSLTACAQLAQLDEYLTPRATSTVSPRFVPANYRRIAVLVIDNTGRSGGGVRRQAEDAFMRAVIGKGYTLAARSDVDRVVDELRFQRSGYTSEDIARVGNMLNVSALLIASIDHASLRSRNYRLRDGGSNTVYYSQATVSARLVSVREAEVLWLASFTGSQTLGDRGNNDEEAIPGVAAVVASALPSAIPPVASPRSKSR